MKVLTIKEPFVTPFALGYKHYETRSWKTNYRGEIYIHTAKEEDLPGSLFLSSFLEGQERFPLGFIVLKGKLTDCIEMTDEFIKEIESDPLEYICGFYEPGRYAWKIENIQKIEPIKVNGHLGLWNYDERNLLFLQEGSGKTETETDDK